ncbi:phosphoglycerate mutase family protein [Gracilibacillus halophilus YIM-C55.5]|uniref:Phosphoglycerate mutase family protein n=1 Tax=Gracilibacillus halophilus YIM-C55.5 TaxID=1308866 RepID=N4WSA7_9BACI|nr:histidine phosphatase family protein [Gracilibacillus halophilus]ENH97285.1 phosphoglycerate mutase family protein [Gracilibacillus halophilus YIM-C55.5]
MKRILLVRHCDALGQHKDSPLTKKGLQQAYELARLLERQSFSIDHIICSPYLRSVESIRPFANRMNISIKTDERLKERVLSEEPVDDWLEILEESFQNYQLKLPGGESSNDAFLRANELLDECMTNATNENFLLVTHGNLLTLMLKKFHADVGFQDWKNLSNPDVYVVQRIGGEYMVERLWEEPNQW